MYIAYIISAYKNPRQLIRLSNRLYDPSTSLFIHVDKKTIDPIYLEMLSGLSNRPNIFFLKRYRCDWGTFGHVQATIEGINEIIKRRIPFDYVVLLTGQDYPIKTNEQIHQFFALNDGKSFMEYFPLPSDNWEGGGMQRLEQWHVRLFSRHYTFPKSSNSIFRRRFPNSFKPFGGSSYWCLSRACIEYLYGFISNHRRYLNFFRYVDVPDELFFQTILLNSSLAGSIVNDDARFISWKDITSGSPAILDRSDFANLVSSPKLFARKFDQTVDSEILDMIDRAIT